MSERRFRRTSRGVCWLGLHLVSYPKYQRRVLGGRVARRSGEHWSPSYFAASVGYVCESTVRRYIEHQWDAVAS